MESPRPLRLNVKNQRRSKLKLTLLPRFEPLKAGECRSQDRYDQCYPVDPCAHECFFPAGTPWYICPVGRRYLTTTASSPARSRLLLDRSAALACAAMRDPRTTLTAQDLIYAVAALRAGARRAERQAADPQYASSRHVFEHAARGNDALAAKFDAIAKALPSHE